MASGGARNRSGPQPVEGSRTSDRRGYSLTALPSAGFDGDVPGFPLPPRLAGDTEDFNSIAEQVHQRELDMWAWAWTTPQACAWIDEAWRWPTVAMWVRTFVLCESQEATAADKGSLHRFADQIGLTPAGLKENGWKIADPKPADTEGNEPAPANVTSIKDRLNRGGA